MNRTLAAIASIASLTSAFAAPLTYTEDVSGDINNGFFALDFGTNQISGRLHFVTTRLPDGTDVFDVDRDEFDFSIPFGSRLASASITTAFFATGATLNMSLGFSLLDDSGQFIDQSCVPVFGPPNCALFFRPPSTGALFTDAMPLSGTSFQFRSTAAWGGFLPTSGGSTDYTLSFLIQPIPEPESLLLVPLALAVLQLTGANRGSGAGRTELPKERKG